MKTYIIGYDLNRPRGASDYPNLINAIKSIGLWWHHLDSTWLVNSNQSAEQIRNNLVHFIDSGDELLVIAASREAAWHGFNEKGSSWIKDNLLDQH